MPKIKFSIKELKRISLIIASDVQTKKATLENIKKQEWSNEQRQENQILMIEDDISFVKRIKEKIDSETFGRG